MVDCTECKGDISEEGVAKARRLVMDSQANVNITVASWDDYSWPQNHHDGVATIFVHFADPDLHTRLFANMVRSLKPGGSLTLLWYTPKQLEYRTGGSSVLSHLYAPETLREAFGDLEIQILDECETELKVGDGHKGRSAVVGLVGVRRYSLR